MSQKLANAPLTYVLGQVKISPILDIQRHIPAIQEKLRKDFPKFGEIESYALNAQPHQKDVRISTQWHFYDKDSSTGVLLETDTIILHTSNYSDYEDFSGSFEKLLDILNEVLKISLYTRLGLRYINLIDNNIETHAKKELLGFPLNFEDVEQSNLGFYRTESIIKTKCKGFIKIQSTYTSIKELNRKDFIIFVPPELSPIASLLAFNRPEPLDKFVLLDIDHFMHKNDVDFNVKDILSNFQSLHRGVSNAFLSAVTPEVSERKEVKA